MAEARDLKIGVSARTEREIREEVAEEIAKALEVVNDGYLMSPIRAARIARDIGSKEGTP
jgi:hypothetical protein